MHLSIPTQRFLTKTKQRTTMKTLKTDRENCDMTFGHSSFNKTIDQLSRAYKLNKMNLSIQFFSYNFKLQT